MAVMCRALYWRRWLSPLFRLRLPLFSFCPAMRVVGPARHLLFLYSAAIPCPLDYPTFRFFLIFLGTSLIRPRQPFFFLAPHFISFRFGSGFLFFFSLLVLVLFLCVFFSFLVLSPVVGRPFLAFYDLHAAPQL